MCLIANLPCVVTTVQYVSLLIVKLWNFVNVVVLLSNLNKSLTNNTLNDLSHPLSLFLSPSLSSSLFQLTDLLKRNDLKLNAVVEFCVENEEILIDRITGR